MSLFSSPFAPIEAPLAALPSSACITPQSMVKPPPLGPRAPNPKQMASEKVPQQDRYAYAVQQPAEVWGQDSLRYDIM